MRKWLHSPLVRLIPVTVTLLVLIAPALAQVSVNYVFTAGTVIDPDQVNDNFAQMQKALNRTGGSVTGPITSTGGSLDGAWAGNPNFTDNPIFSGNPFLQGTMLVTGTLQGGGATISGLWNGVPNFTTGLALGPFPAQSGDLRFSNSSVIKARNNANTGDLVLLGNFPDDKIYVGGTVVGGVADAGLVLRSAVNDVYVAGGRLRFPAAQNASTDPNALDDYEEIVFTPVLAGTVNSTGVTYARQTGFAVKVGNRIWYDIHITVGVPGGLNGNVVIGGLPVASNTFYFGVNIPSFNTLAANVLVLGGYSEPGTTFLNLTKGTTAGGGMGPLLSTDVLPSANIIVSGTYLTAN